MAIVTDFRPFSIPNYRVLHRLGAGGMGEVYAGVDETLQRRVALKAVRPEYRLDAKAKARFLREAQILSQLDHPNICRVYNYVEGGDTDWLVLELIEGKSLRDVLDGGLSAPERMSIAQQIAQVLVVTHGAGVVHRDLKPGNVMISDTGAVKVLDFGLARSLSAGGRVSGTGEAAEAPGPTERAENTSPAASPEWPRPSEFSEAATLLPSTGDETEYGTLIGTVEYMSPEQARCEPATSASDLYSFGLMLQEIFSGQRPRAGKQDGNAMLAQARRGESPPPTGIDADLARLILRLKSLAPAERPTAVDTLERLRWIAAKPRRRIRRLAIAAVVALAALGGAKYFFDLEAERTVAVQAQREAEGRRKQAEDLIGFMLGDLRTKLAKVGRLEILDEVGMKAMDYFAAVPESSLTDEELAQRSAALYQIGDVRITQGRLADAVKPLAQSLALARTLANRHPDDASRLFDLAQSEFWMGFVEWRQRHLDPALVHFREYFRIAERLVAIDANNPVWQLELASANSNIGSVLEEQGDLAGALERFQATQVIERRLLERSPDDPSLIRSVAATNNAIGSVLGALGRLDDSLASHRAELALQEDLVRREPGTAGWRQYLGVSHNRVAAVLEALGRMPEATAHIEKALSVHRALVAEDPANVDWQRELGRSCYRSGLILLAQGMLADAKRRLEEGLTIFGRVAGLDPLNLSRQRDLAEVHNALGLFSLAHGAPRRAEAEARQAYLIANRLLERARDDRQASGIRGASLEIQGRAWASLGSRDRAVAAWTAAVSTLEPIARTSRDYRILEPWARALLALGRVDAARAVVRTLHMIGYRHPAFVSTILRSGLGVRPPETVK